MRYFIAFFIVLFSLSVNASDFRPLPETNSGFKAGKVAKGSEFMAVTANPHATEAAYRILKRGGTAIDAAIAAQAVLGLVEPQSSGLGGGAFVLYFDAENKKILSYDGREMAPKRATPELFLDQDGNKLDFYDAVLSGKSIGVPGTPMLMDVMHQKHGRIPFDVLMEPAIEIAEQGFKISPRLSRQIQEEVKNDRVTDDFNAYFSNGKGAYKKTGDVLKNPDYARSLELLATAKGQGFYRSELVEKIVSKANRHGGVLRKSDFEKYQVLIRSPVCEEYKNHVICSMAEPSSGGITILQALKMLERFPLKEWGKDDLRSWHVIAEASRLAFADRNRYIADPEFAGYVASKLLNPAYVEKRSKRINMSFSNGEVLPGNVDREQGTSHISIIDAQGNVVSMTTTIESAFGSHHMVGGFFLNNEMTDFDFKPESELGNQKVNRVEGGKRPRSSMAPTIVFDSIQKPVLVIGSAGGSRIIGYILQRLISVIDWEMDIKSALDSKNILARGYALEMEDGSGDDAMVEMLQAKNHYIKKGPQASGLTAIHVKENKYFGYADPRREGIAMGQ